MQQKRTLVAYFSRKGNNYLDGKIVNLPIGNTELLAKMIQEITGADIFRIETVIPYPLDYKKTTEVAGKELREKARPTLSNQTEHMDLYNMVFLCYPNWWGTIPMPIAAFLTSYDFSGKTIVPFCTNEGSGLGKSIGNIKELCPHSIVVEGLAIRGGAVSKAKNEVSQWLRKLKIIQ